MNGYTNERMNLVEVCEWLNKRGMGASSEMILKAFEYHTWTVNGMTRTDVLKDVFAAIDQSGHLFKQLECDVITHMEFIPAYEAHVD